MVRKPDPDLDLRAQQAAFLMAYHPAVSQDALRKLLPNEPSQAQFSRFLDHAKHKGWYEVRREFHSRGLDKGRISELQRLVAPQDLLELLQRERVDGGGCLSSLRVFETGRVKGSDKRLARHSAAAAVRVIELLHRSELVGVTWGNALRALVDALIESRQKPTRKLIELVPVCAEVLTSTNPGNSSSQLASRLNEFLNEGEGEQFSFSGLQAYRPLGMTKAQLKKWEKDFISGSESYLKVFKRLAGSAALIDRIDTVLTSVSSEGYPMRALMNELKRVGGRSARSIDLLIDGDIGGVLLPKDGLAAKDRKIVEDLNAAFIGIKYADMRRIAADAEAEDRVGVVVVACGGEKMPAVLAALRHGLVSHLLIDAELSAALKKQLQRA